MKKLLGLMTAVMMLLTVMLPIFASAEEPVTISFFDKNSGVRTFTDPVAQELEARTGIRLDLISPSGNPGEKLSLMLAGLNYPDIVLMDRSSDIVNQYIPSSRSISSRESCWARSRADVLRHRKDAGRCLELTEAFCQGNHAGRCRGLTNIRRSCTMKEARFPARHGLASFRCQPGLFRKRNPGGNHGACTGTDV